LLCSLAGESFEKGKLEGVKQALQVAAALSTDIKNAKISELNNAKGVMESGIRSGS
jgi:hypothetical protein